MKFLIVLIGTILNTCIPSFAETDSGLWSNRPTTKQGKKNNSTEVLPSTALVKSSAVKSDALITKIGSKADGSYTILIENVKYPLYAPNTLHKKVLEFAMNGRTAVINQRNFKVVDGRTVIEIFDIEEYHGVAQKQSVEHTPHNLTKSAPRDRVGKDWGSVSGETHTLYIPVAPRYKDPKVQKRVNDFRDNAKEGDSMVIDGHRITIK